MPGRDAPSGPQRWATSRPSWRQRWGARLLRHVDRSLPSYGLLRNRAPAGSLPWQSSRVVAALLSHGWIAAADVAHLRLLVSDADPLRPATPRQRWTDRARYLARRLAPAPIGSHAEFLPQRHAIHLNEVGLIVDGWWANQISHYRTLAFLHELGHGLIGQASVRLFDRLPSCRAAAQRQWPLRLHEAVRPPVSRYAPIPSEYRHLFTGSGGTGLKHVAEEMYADCFCVAALACVQSTPVAVANGKGLLHMRQREQLMQADVARAARAAFRAHATAPALSATLAALQSGVWRLPADPLAQQRELLECVAQGLAQLERRGCLPE